MTINRQKLVDIGWGTLAVCVVLAFIVSLFLVPIRHALAQTVEVGAGLICDSADQASRFVELVAAASPAEAVEIINAENPSQANACGIVTVAYVKKDEVKQIGKLSVTEISVIGWHDGAQWHRFSEPQIQFSVFPAKGADA